MLQELDFDLESITLDIQNIAKEARKDALSEIEQDARFPEIVRVFQNVCNS